MNWKLYFTKVYAFIGGSAVLHTIFVISVDFSFKYTKYMINLDVLLIIMICAYAHLFYTIFIKQQTKGETE